VRLLFWAAIVFAIVKLLQLALKPRVSADSTKRQARHEAGEAMLKCEHCGLYFPASEALSASSGAVFCCEEHRAQHRAK
jgi:uncharacterized protein